MTGPSARFWLANGERVMHASDYRRGTILDGTAWRTTGEVTVEWDDGFTTIVSKFDLEPIYVEGH